MAAMCAASTAALGEQRRRPQQGRSALRWPFMRQPVRRKNRSPPKLSGRRRFIVARSPAAMSDVTAPVCVVQVTLSGLPSAQFSIASRARIAASLSRFTGMVARITHLESIIEVGCE